MWQHKTFSFINTLGLAIGIACCILIFLYVQHELRHDRFHKNADTIYRLIIQETASAGEIKLTTLLPQSLPNAIEEELPGVIRTSGFLRSEVGISYQNKKFGEAIGLVDDSFLRMFSFPLLAGDPTTALSEPNNVVITEDVARKVFGVSDGAYHKILGELITLHSGKYQDYIISGVMKSIPNTSSIQFGIVDANL